MEETRYVVYDRYGNSNSDGILYKPRSTGKKSYEDCQKWMQKNDNGNGIILTMDEINKAD